MTASGENPVRRDTAWPAIRALRQLGAGVLDALLPPRYLGCGTAIGADGALCADCWRSIDFIDGPVCSCCGLPFEFDAGEDALCGVCLRSPPAYSRARAVMRYNEASRGLILGFKHGDRTDGAPTYGAWLARAGAGILESGTLIVPVPLHRRRLFRRRYNQSALLALALGRISGPAVRVDLLKRVKPTPSLGGLSATARHKTVRGAFAVAEAGRADVRDAHVLLIDDVLTTGATVDACAKVLVRAGAARVDVLTLARVVRASTI